MIKVSAFLFPAVIGLCSPVHAQTPGIDLIQDMHFGSLSLDQRGGMVTLTSDRLLVPLSPGVRPGGSLPCREARFLLSGQPGSRFYIKLDPQNPILTQNRGGALTVAEFFSSLPGFQGVFDSKGEAELRLGAKLDIRNHTPSGLYQSTQVKLQLHVIDPASTKTASRSFSISALLMPNLTLTNTAPLVFAALITGSTQGTFLVSPNGSYRALDANGPTLLKGIPHPARFTLRGPAETCYHIQLPTVASLVGPGTPIVLKDFTCSAPRSGALSKDGLDFYVGGSLVVPPHQQGGSYRGVFTVTVNYQ